MGRLTATPCSQLQALEFAGNRRQLRKVLFYQVRHTDAYLIRAGGEPVALAMFFEKRKRLVEFAMTVKPEAAAHMTGLVRLAHLTLARFAQDGLLVMAHIRSSDARAQRMARMVGFTPGHMRDHSIWFFRGPTA
jgi:hypothetical protein